jgi:hypothetical protein
VLAPTEHHVGAGGRPERDAGDDREDPDDHVAEALQAVALARDDPHEQARAPEDGRPEDGADPRGGVAVAIDPGRAHDPF